MTPLDLLIPTPRLVETDAEDLALPLDRAWEVVRHTDFARLFIVRALFAIRTLPTRLLHPKEPPLSFTFDSLVSTPEKPGFQVYHDEAPVVFAVGAIGKVWESDIPFVHLTDAKAFAAFDTPGFAKVAWSISLEPAGEQATRVTFEVRVDATDDAAWQKFRTYFRFIGPGSRLIRRMLLAGLAREFGSPTSVLEKRNLPGDALLPDAAGQVTKSIEINATPEKVWPWLVQMGAGRAGFYSVDLLDNGGLPSAEEIHPELQHLRVGQILKALPDHEDGFEVLAIDPHRSLILGGLHDAALGKQLPFTAARPDHFWQTTWAFILEPIGDQRVRLITRARAAFPEQRPWHATWIVPVHHFMQAAQLRHIAQRASQQAHRTSASDVASGFSGALIMLAAFLSPFLRGARGHWGVTAEAHNKVYPGDTCVPHPNWSWTHGIEINAPMAEVWPWIAQLGADKGGFYSYEWLENLAGCDVRNAETVHPEWRVREGGSLSLHPKMPALRVVDMREGEFFVVYGGPPNEPSAESHEGAVENAHWVRTSWLFYLEPIDEKRCRLISRYRCACSKDLVSRLEYGPTLLEPIGFAMDRRMLLGVKERAERWRPAA